MARKRAHKKRMTITQKYNRIAKGLLFFGVEQEEKKRATTKQLKQLQKIYKQIRKSLQEAGEIDLPSIAQASKFITEQDKEIQAESEKEPLPYADEDTRSYINFPHQVIEEFKELLFASIRDCFHLSPAFMYASRYQTYLIKKEQEFISFFSRLTTEQEEQISEALTQSTYWDRIKSVAHYHYSDIVDFYDSLYDNLISIITEATPTLAEPETYEKGISFENL